MTQQGYFHKWLTIGIILMSMAAGFSSVIAIANTENVVSKGTVNPQFSRLTRKDISVLSNAIVLTKDAETRELLKEVRDKVSESGCITEQEIKDLAEGSGWTPFIGKFAVRRIYDYQVRFVPGYHIFKTFGIYVGPFIVGFWENYIVFLGLGLAFRYQSDPGARIFTDFVGICTLGFYK
jgi:hypothetical protein